MLFKILKDVLNIHSVIDILEEHREKIQKILSKKLKYFPFLIIHSGIDTLKEHLEKHFQKILTNIFFFMFFHFGKKNF